MNSPRWNRSRCRALLRLRERGWSLQRIASRYGVTKERIRQVEAKALRRERWRSAK